MQHAKPLQKMGTSSPSWSVYGDATSVRVQKEPGPEANFRPRGPPKRCLSGRLADGKNFQADLKKRVPTGAKCQRICACMCLDETIVAL